MAAETKRDLQKSKIKTALVVGLVGGIFWSLIGYALYYMNFTTLGPSIFAKTFVNPNLVNKPWVQMMGVAVITLLSLAFALLYVFTLSKYYTPWIGVASGIVLFLLFFYGASPLFGLTVKPIHEMGMNTFTTEFCLFLLYGLFIGFSLSAEFSSNEEKAK